MTHKIEYRNPQGLFKSPGLSQVALVNGDVRSIHTGGLCAVDAAGQLVGEGDLRVQAERVLRNLEIALASAEARFEHIVRWRLYLLAGQGPETVLQVFQRVWRSRQNPPLMTFLYVSGFAHPGFLLQVEADACVPLE